jgi:hypothetical protein
VKSAFKSSTNLGLVREELRSRRRELGGGGWGSGLQRGQSAVNGERNGHPIILFLESPRLHHEIGSPEGLQSEGGGG